MWYYYTHYKGVNMFPERNPDRIFDNLRWLMEFESRQQDKKQNNLELVCEGLVIKKKNSNEMWGTSDGKAACIYFGGDVANSVKSSLENPEEWGIIHIGVFNKIK